MYMHNLQAVLSFYVVKVTWYFIINNVQVNILI
jgi:hypothetical protein